MIRKAETTFAGDPRSARKARRFAEQTLGAWGAHDLTDPAVLLISEVVTNGVLHARTEVDVKLQLDGERLLVEVWDRDPHNVRPRNPGDEATGGRGLLIVDALSGRWGTRHDGDTKCVWFEVKRGGNDVDGTRAPVRSLEPAAAVMAEAITGTVEDSAAALVTTVSPPPAGPPLTSMLSSAPAAVLLIDRAREEITFGNQAALELLDADLTLPVAVGDWAEAAGFTRPGGLPLGPDETPLARVVAGEHVRGEPLTCETVAGTRVLWATGWVLPSIPDLPDSGIVALFDISGLGADQPLRELRDRAILATERSFTISDPSLPDDPLVYANPAFERMTGYTVEESVGHNCRFLQGPGTDPAAVDELRLGLRERRQTTVTLLNYRKDGTAFWNEVAISPVLDGSGELTHFVGVQSDVTARVLAEHERERLYLAEQQARAEAEAASVAAEAARAEAEETQHRLGLLAEATTLLTTSLDVETTLRRLTALMVPIFADWSVVDLLDENGRPRRVGVGHLDPRLAARLLELEQRYPIDLNAPTPSAAVLRGGPAQLMPEVTDDWLARSIRSPELLAAYRQAGPMTSIVTVPLRARGKVLGALSLIGIGAGRRFGEADLRLAEDLGRRAGLAVDNARSFERELRVAETLQRTLLPSSAPKLAGFELAVRYVPGSAGVKVGGDWYDLIPGLDGSAVVVVGDVMGHDLRAAALMGRLRSALRAYAIEDDRPGTLVGRLDNMMQRLEEDELATLVVARISPDGTSVTYANAGHPPPLLVAPDGSTQYLEEGRSVLLGVAAEVEHAEATIAIDPGATLLLYTDGLVEERNTSVGEGLAILADEAARRAGSGLETTCDAILGRLEAAKRADDIALLAIRSRVNRDE